MYQRFIEEKITKSNMPVIFINGARQVGKSTLVKSLFGKTHDYLTLDDPQVLSLALRDPINFIKNASGPLIIDEIQRCPDLLLAIKISVDEIRKPKHFILTGSVNLLNLQGVKDSLAGRMSVYSLWPLSQEEIVQKSSLFLEHLFKGEVKKPDANFCNIAHAINKGGYPLVLMCENNDQQYEWLQSYLTQILEKDIRDLSNIEGLRGIPNILGLLASRIGGLLNMSELSRSLQIPNTTLKRYLMCQH